MRTSYKGVVSLALSLCFFVPTLSARAEEQAKIDLRLEEALAFSGGMQPFGEALATIHEASDENSAVATRPQPRLGTTDRAPNGVSYQTSEAEAEEELAERVKGEGGFGRWLKKRWYIPVLAAVAIGVAVGDDGSDSPEDEED